MVIKKSIEEIYQKKTQHEHILLRPDTYVGSIERTKQEFWVLNDQEDQFKFEEVDYIPG